MIGLWQKTHFINHKIFVREIEIKDQNRLFKTCSLDTIRNYFGENVAFYFAFLEFYTKALVPTAILGKILRIRSNFTFFFFQGLLVSLWPGSEFLKYSLFCIFNVIWWSVFVSLCISHFDLKFLMISLDGEMEAFKQ